MLNNNNNNNNNNINNNNNNIKIYIIVLLVGVSSYYTNKLQLNSVFDLSSKRRSPVFQHATSIRLTEKRR